MGTSSPDRTPVADPRHGFSPTVTSIEVGPLPGIYATTLRPEATDSRYPQTSRRPRDRRPGRSLPCASSAARTGPKTFSRCSPTYSEMVAAHGPRVTIVQHRSFGPAPAPQRLADTSVDHTEAQSDTVFKTATSTRQTQSTPGFAFRPLVACPSFAHCQLSDGPRLDPRHQGVGNTAQGDSGWYRGYGPCRICDGCLRVSCIRPRRCREATSSESSRSNLPTICPPKPVGMTPAWPSSSRRGRCSLNPSAPASRRWSGPPRARGRAEHRRRLVEQKSPRIRSSRARWYSTHWKTSASRSIRPSTRQVGLTADIEASYAVCSAVATWQARGVVVNGISSASVANQLSPLQWSGSACGFARPRQAMTSNSSPIRPTGRPAPPGRGLTTQSTSCRESAERLHCMLSSAAAQTVGEQRLGILPPPVPLSDTPHPSPFRLSRQAQIKTLLLEEFEHRVLPTFTLGAASDYAILFEGGGATTPSTSSKARPTSQAAAPARAAASATSGSA